LSGDFLELIPDTIFTLTLLHVGFKSKKTKTERSNLLQ